MENQIIEIQISLIKYLKNSVWYKFSSLLFVLFELIGLALIWGLIIHELYWIGGPARMVYVGWNFIYMFLIFKPLLSCFAKNNIILIYVIYLAKAIIIICFVWCERGRISFFEIGKYVGCIGAEFILRNLSFGILFVILHFKSNYCRISSNYRNTQNYTEQ